MKQLYLEIAAAGGLTLLHGPPLRDLLLGKSPARLSLYVHRLTIEQVARILDKLEIPIKQQTETSLVTSTLDIQLLPHIQDLNAQTDFTVNLIYWNPLTDTYYDPFAGRSDLKRRLVRAPGKLFLDNPSKMLDACLTAAEIDGTLEVETWFTIYEQARVLKHIHPWIIGKGLARILSYSVPSKAVRLMQETRMLEYILPELAACENVVQSKRAGVKNVLDHIMYSLDACENDPSLRFTMLFHDIAKPQTMELSLDGTLHFFKHEILGAKIAKEYLKYWGFDKELVQKVVHLVQNHMFDADPKMSERGVRRLVRKVGIEHIGALLKIREADRGGAPDPISMRKVKLLRKKIQKVLDDNVSPNSRRSPKRHSNDTGHTPKGVPPEDTNNGGDGGEGTKPKEIL